MVRYRAEAGISAGQGQIWCMIVSLPPIRALNSNLNVSTSTYRSTCPGMGGGEDGRTAWDDAWQEWRVLARALVAFPRDSEFGGVNWGGISGEFVQVWVMPGKVRSSVPEARGETW